MAKSKERIKARELRKKGRSIKEIARQLKVSKSSASIWCRDIELTSGQIARLEEKIRIGSYKGRLKGARIQLERRLAETNRLYKEGASLLGSLSKRDLLLTGAGLYWGEGTKKRDVRIANSDPEMIRFIINWFNYIWKIPKEQFKFQILINKVHKFRVAQVEKYWLDVAGVSSNQFTKTILIKAKNKKVYKNFETHFGTLMIRVRKSAYLHHKIKGLILEIINQSNKFTEAA
ncbi:MAG TPA: hypothetical protein ENH90_00675 [bacterium]|nr:hypothetical protein [bacterium]